MAPIEYQEDDSAAAYVLATNLTTGFVMPMALKAAVELDVLEIIGEAGPGAQLSTVEIASKMPTSNLEAPIVLDRILRYLASHAVLTCSVVECENGSVERRYGMTYMCKFFRKNKNGHSIVPLLMMNLEKVNQDGWQELKSAVLEGVVPFTKANQTPFFDYHGTDPRFSIVFNESMSCLSKILIQNMLDTYTGFQGVKELVDVAGGIGTSLAAIVSKFPHIKGTNFDLPHVISKAPPLPGVKHVDGDMFVSVPSGDAIFLKFVLHNWSQEHCLKLLKNCYKALPDSGKVIILENKIPESPEINARTQMALSTDLCMLSYCDGGKTRTQRELEFLAIQAGFSSFNVACYVYGVYVMELLK